MKIHHIIMMLHAWGWKIHAWTSFVSNQYSVEVPDREEMLVHKWGMTEKNASLLIIKGCLESRQFTLGFVLKEYYTPMSDITSDVGFALGSFWKLC